MDVHRDQGKEPLETEVARPRKRAPGTKPWKLYYSLNPARWWMRGWHVKGRYARVEDAVEAYRTESGKEERNHVEEARRWAFKLVDPEGEEVALYQPDWDKGDQY